MRKHQDVLVHNETRRCNMLTHVPVIPRTKMSYLSCRAFFPEDGRALIASPGGEASL